jgi:hypothetical protein
VVRIWTREAGIYLLFQESKRIIYDTLCEQASSGSKIKDWNGWWSRDYQAKDSTLKIMLIDFGTCKIFLWLCLLCDVQYVQALLHLPPSTMHPPPQIKPPCNPSFQARRNEPEAIPFSPFRLNFGEIFVTCMSHHPSIHPQSYHLATTTQILHRWRINVIPPRTKANPSSASHKIIISLEQ